MTRFMLTCMVALLFLPHHFARAEALPERPAATAGRAAGRELVVERERRLLQRTLDDLRLERKLAEGDIGELERQTDAITLLESPRREEDFRDLLDWYYRYLDWLGAQEDEFDWELAELSASPSADGEPWAGRFGAMAEKERELTEELREKVREYSAEQKRLAGIIDRRLLLQALFADLGERLALLEKRLSDRQRPPSEKEKEEAARLRIEVRVVQGELLSLPDLDEDILKHYAVMIERARWQGDWLALKGEEYEALRAVAAMLPRDGAAVADAYRRVIRTWEVGIRRLGRMIDELDRKRSRISPAGTLRAMDRSRELAGLYDGLQGRFDDRIRQLKVLIGAYEAELAEIFSGRP